MPHPFASSSSSSWFSSYCVCSNGIMEVDRPRRVTNFVGMSWSSRLGLTRRTMGRSSTLASRDLVESPILRSMASHLSFVICLNLAFVIFLFEFDFIWIRYCLNMIFLFASWENIALVWFLMFLDLGIKPAPPAPHHPVPHTFSPFCAVYGCDAKKGTTPTPVPHAQPYQWQPTD